jgi:hypothetical protein
VQSTLRRAVKGLSKFLIGMTSKWYWVVLAYIVSRLLAILTFTQLEHWSVMDAYWWGEVASLTIGYGDIAPKTTLGRFLATPFHFFWVYYCGLALGAHIIYAVFKNKNEWTHSEQEWTFRVLSVMFGWIRWLVQVQLNNPGERRLPPVPYTDEHGALMDCPAQAADTDDGDLPVGV